MTRSIVWSHILPRPRFYLLTANHVRSEPHRGCLERPVCLAANAGPGCRPDQPAATDARQDASAAAASAKTKWAQMKADAAAKMDDLQARIDKRADQLDANVAADDAAWAEDDAAAAIDYASWTVDNARLAVLDAIDARVYADELATRAGA